MYRYFIFFNDFKVDISIPQYFVFFYISTNDILAVSVSTDTLILYIFINIQNNKWQIQIMNIV